MLLLFFLLLQFLDGATTLAFLSRGVAEGNPLVRAALHLSANPSIALALVKTAACALAIFAWRTGRLKLLRRANVFFAFCVVWNLAAMLSL